MKVSSLILALGIASASSVPRPVGAPSLCTHELRAKFIRERGMVASDYPSAEAFEAALDKALSRAGPLYNMCRNPRKLDEEFQRRMDMVR